MAKNYDQLTANDTFGGWLQRTNDLSNDLSTVVVTTASVAQPNTVNGGETSGNAHIEGYLSASHISVVNDLKGGTLSAPAPLKIASNVNFTSNLITTDSNTVFQTNSNVEIKGATKILAVSAGQTNFTGANVVFAGTNITANVSDITFTSTNLVGDFSNSYVLAEDYTVVANNGLLDVDNLTVTTTSGVVNATLLSVAGNTVFSQNTHFNAVANVNHLVAANTTIADLDVTGTSKLRGLTIAGTTTAPDISATGVIDFLTDVVFKDVVTFTGASATVDSGTIFETNSNVSFNGANSVVTIGAGQTEFTGVNVDFTGTNITANVADINITSTNYDATFGTATIAATSLAVAGNTVFSQNTHFSAVANVSHLVAANTTIADLDVTGTSQLKGLTVAGTATNPSISASGTITFSTAVNLNGATSIANGSATTFTVQDLVVLGNTELNSVKVTGGTLDGDLRWSDGNEARFGDGNDLVIKHDGFNSYVTNTTGSLYVRADSLEVDSANGENFITALSGGDVKLYYANAEKLATAANGIDVTGDVNATGSIRPTLDVYLKDNKRLYVGNGNDLGIWHNGSHSYIAHSGIGDLIVRTENVDEDIYIRTMTTENAIHCVPNGGVELYYNNVNKLFTKSTGVEVNGSLDVDADGNFTGNVNAVNGVFSGNLTVQGATTTLNTTLDLNGSMTGTSAVFSGNVQADGALKVDSTRGIGNVTGSYGNIQTTGTGVGSWDGYSIGGEVVFMNNGVSFGIYDDVNNHWAFKASPNGGSSMYYNGNEKLITTNSGATLAGNFSPTGNVEIVDSKYLLLGTSNDFRLYHDGLNSYVDNNTGDLRISTPSNMYLYVNNTEASVAGFANGKTSIYYNNIEKFFTRNDGAEVQGTLYSDDISSTAATIGGKLNAATVVVGENGGSTGLTFNDGYGNASVTFNHVDGIPDRSGSSGRISTTVDSTTGLMTFEIADNVTSGVAIDPTIVTTMRTANTTFHNVVYTANDLHVGNDLHVNATMYSLGLDVSNLFAANTTYLSSSVSGKPAAVIYKRIDDATEAPVMVVAGDGESGDIIASFRANAAGGSVDIGDGPISLDDKVVIYGNGDISSTGTVTSASIGTGPISSGNVSVTGNITATGTLSSGNVSVTGNITATGTISSTSDRRLKENVETVNGALGMVKDMRGVYFNMVGETERSVGVIAQEMEEILPEVVQTNSNDLKSVSYGNVVGVLIEAIKEQQAQIEELKSMLYATR